MANLPVLTTERLVLRVPDERDVAPNAAFLADPEATVHLGGPQSPGRAWRTLATIIGAWHLRGFSFFSVTLRDTGEWIGRAGPWFPDGWPDREIGWGIAPAHQRKGYGKEAASACMDWVFSELGWERVIHVIDPTNAPSIALAASLGSARLRTEPNIDPIGHPVDIYGQSRTQWLGRE